MKRVFLTVIDSFGIGAAPDAAAFRDEGANTLRSISRSGNFHIPNLLSLGFGQIDGIGFLEKEPLSAAVCRLSEVSRGKDTTVGHFEIAGALSEYPLPTYPEGFPAEVIKAFTEATGYGVLCNKPYSGTDAIRDYGEEHLRTGKLIVYTSADSVFQIAAHEELVPVEKLYEICGKARALLTGKHGVGRVIARPFLGKPGEFFRTANRRDFSLKPPCKTMLDAVSEGRLDMIAVGKISDIYAGQGITESYRTHGNAEGMAKTLELGDRDFSGLCFTNLVDTDMLYGHRQDVDGYAKAVSEIDAWLPEMIAKLGEEDCLMITADHGCDPGDDSTDHTREYIPFLAIGKKIGKVNLGTRGCFADIGRTVCDLLGVAAPFSAGDSMAGLILKS